MKIIIHAKSTHVVKGILIITKLHFCYSWREKKKTILTIIYLHFSNLRFKIIIFK